MVPGLGLAAAAAAAALGLAGCDAGSSSAGKPGSAGSFNSLDVSGANYAKDFSLADMHGQRRTLADFRGKVVAMFFGYTQCPDVCPTTLSEMVQVKRLLGADASRLQVLFVTVDPARDTPQMLQQYMANFDPTFLALVPTPQEGAGAQAVELAQKAAALSDDDAARIEGSKAFCKDLMKKYGTPSRLKLVVAVHQLG